MDITDEDVRRFAALFSGYELAHGTYEIRGKAADGKVTGKAQTMRGGATPGHYRAHLEGKGSGVGIIMLRQDNTVCFGAIDYDVKTMDHVKAEAQIRALNLPLILCRSKSGGGHFYCFAAEPIPAVHMLERLSEWRAVLGMSDKTEVFPKQTSRYDASDIGNWINIPYFGVGKDTGTNRYGYHMGIPLDLKGFLELAESRRVTPDMMQLPAKATSRDTDEETLFLEGPPCLQLLEAQGGFVQGTKKEGMFNVGVYLRKRYPDDWKEHIDRYNATMAQIKSDEVQGIVKQVGKKEYSYKCSQPPINSCCNKRLCRMRMWGVGSTDGEDGQGVSIGALIRYDSSNGDDPLFAMEVNGKRVLVTTSQLYSRDEFNRACISQANVIPVHMTPVRWLKFLGKFLPTADVVPLPEDASPTGQLWEYITMFLTQSVIATEREKIQLGVPYREGDKMYFRSIDLFKFLDARRLPYKSPQQVWEVLRQRGADKGFWNIHGRGINYWSLPAPARDEDVYRDRSKAEAEDEAKEAF